MSFGAGFKENVSFAATGAAGTLSLAQSRSYTGTVSGFSHTPATKFDLRDISFASGTTTAHFVENSQNTAGVLTVTDTVHHTTATIHLTGVYSPTGFTTATDTKGGTLVFDPPAQGSLGTPKVPGLTHFVSAMAGFGGDAAASAHAWVELHAQGHHPILAMPSIMRV